MVERNYSESEVKKLVGFVWKARDDIDYLKELPAQIRAEEGLEVSSVQEEIRDVVRYMERHPEIFGDYIRAYREFADEIPTAINNFLASELESLLGEKRELFVERLEEGDSVGITSEPDDDLPF